jgi:hypothetical protein
VSNEQWDIHIVVIRYDQAHLSHNQSRRLPSITVRPYVIRARFCVLFFTLPLLLLEGPGRRTEPSTQNRHAACCLPGGMQFSSPCSSMRGPGRQTEPPSHHAYLADLLWSITFFILFPSSRSFNLSFPNSLARH